MSTNYNTCFIDSNGRDVSEEFVEKSYLLDVYPSLINQAKAPGLWMWGFNDADGALGGPGGSLGTNDGVSQSSPVQTVSAGYIWKQVNLNCHSAAIKTDGTLWLWGDNPDGRLGDNSIISKSSPVQTVSGGTNWKQVSLGSTHSAAVKTDGTLWSWGSAAEGALGVGPGGTSRSSPVQTVSAGTNWKQVAAGFRFSAAIKTDGTLWTWGTNVFGNLGNNTAVSTSSPVQTVSGGTNWYQVDVGSNCDARYVAAIKTDGSLWLWGAGSSGRLGNNSTVDRSSPVQTVSGGTNWKQVSLAVTHSAAIKTDGSLWLWGNGLCGALGNNSTVDRSSPVQTVSGGTNWKQVSVGGTSSGVSAAIKTDGSLWTWGSNFYFQLGNNGTPVRTSSPVQTVSGGNNWKFVDVGITTTGAIREEGDW